MIAPFFVGMIADRFFSTERVVIRATSLPAAAILYWLSGVVIAANFILGLDRVFPDVHADALAYEFDCPFTTSMIRPGSFPGFESPERSAGSWRDSWWARCS